MPAKVGMTIITNKKELKHEHSWLDSESVRNSMYQFFILLFCLMFTLITENCMANSLSTIETQIKHFASTQQVEQLSLLEKIVNINSGTNNISGVVQVGEILNQKFKQLGFETQWIEEPKSLQRAGTLIAYHKGTTGKRVLLIGHLDTVFPKASTFQQFIRHVNTASGPGVVDMKGGDVVILFALKALQAAHALDNANITVILTGDEEDSGKPTSISRAPLIKLAKENDVALDFEMAFNLGTATIARRGIEMWTLETSGIQAHSSEIFKKRAGDGAIYELARILNSLRSTLSTEKYLSINPGLVLGGTSIDYDLKNSHGSTTGKANVIAERAMVHGDLRFLTLAQKKQAEIRIQKIVKKHLAGTLAKISFLNGIPPMMPTKNNYDLLKKLSEVSQAMGYGAVKPLDPGARGAGDISFVANIVPANLAGLGPVGYGAHSTHEKLELDSLPICTQRAAILIYRLTREGVE
ncbi:MAG: M20/M25/M40 family metallo-hydrolase [Gammaproteobacteria bacterium]